MYLFAARAQASALQLPALLQKWKWHSLRTRALGLKFYILLLKSITDPQPLATNIYIVDLRSNSFLGQSIGTPAEHFLALLWVSEGLCLANLEFSILLNNGYDSLGILEHPDVLHLQKSVLVGDDTQDENLLSINLHA